LLFKMHWPKNYDTLLSLAEVAVPPNSSQYCASR
jgi:hypothetical protein